MKKLTALVMTLALAFSLAACGATSAPSGGTGTSEPVSSAPADSQPADSTPALPTVDPSGAPITVPGAITSVVVLAPSITETVVALGWGDAIVGYDMNSVGLAGIPAGVPTFDTVAPDVEQLVALAPDVLLVSSLSLYDQEAPYQPLMDAGVCVVCIPTSESIAGVESDIAFLAALLGEDEAGAALIADMEAQLDAVRAIAATIPEEERKTVFFEISPAPWLYSFGSGEYLNEMLEVIGAKNILADQQGWLPVEAETVVAADPDVILSNVNFNGDPVPEILARDGWADVTAVREGAVYYIDNMASSLPNHNITKALWQMARAIYPAYFAADTAA